MVKISEWSNNKIMNEGNSFEESEKKQEGKKRNTERDKGRKRETERE